MSRRHKRKTPHQQQALERARSVLAQKRQGETNLQVTPSVQSLKMSVSLYREKFKSYQRKYWNEHRRNLHLQASCDLRKVDLERAREETDKLQQMIILLRKRADKAIQMGESTRRELSKRVEKLKETNRGLHAEHSRLRKRMGRLGKAQIAMKEKVKAASQRHPTIFRIMRRGAYTTQARSLARYLQTIGMAEHNVGEAIQKVGRVLGVEVDFIMNRRTVRRSVEEGGVASDIQLGYEMATTNRLTYSSDNTSHKHIEYESRTIALEVIDYLEPEQHRQWKLRSIGVNAVLDHTSETQVRGLKERLSEIARAFNNSPLAKRGGLQFNPDDFAFRLLGTTGDHASDQKRTHNMLSVWRLEIILQRMGEEALFQMDEDQLGPILTRLKPWQFDEYGGRESWREVVQKERENRDIDFIKKLGREVFNALDKQDRDRLTRCIRTGCSMHKDLNSVRGGDKAMQEMWEDQGKTPPVTLPNEGKTTNSRGGSHTTTLGGMICRNKDKKKGQQDTYSDYMAAQVGEHVPYPDVSNTRYGSHGAAAGTLLAYRKQFMNFGEYVRTFKKKVNLTNIEMNFFRMGLTDKPTLVELCVLALHHIAISRPFMGHIRNHGNILLLKPFFKSVVDFLDLLHYVPQIWTSSNSPYAEASLNPAKDGNWDKFSQRVWDAVHDENLTPSLGPDLDMAVSRFVRGARQVLVENFMEEFREGGDIDKMTEEEKNDLYFTSTNDKNEGSLGSMRNSQHTRPGQTIDMFSSMFRASENNTEDFIAEMLNDNENQEYLRSEGRKRDENSGEANRQRKERQIEAGKRKGEENEKRVEQLEKKKEEKRDAIEKTSHELVLQEDDIAKLTKDKLNEQLDFHRDKEAKLPTAQQLPPTDRVPLKTHMKTNAERKIQLQKASQRYCQRQGMTTVSCVGEEDVPMRDADDLAEDSFYVSDHEDSLA